jgi:hypothetical protein
MESSTPPRDTPWAMSEENVELARAFFDAYNARDSEAVDRLLDPDAEITTLTGRAGIRLGSELSAAFRPKRSASRPRGMEGSFPLPGDDCASFRPPFPLRCAKRRDEGAHTRGLRSRGLERLSGGRSPLCDVC